jgi:CBS domain-containing protein
MLAKDIMTKELITVSPEATLQEAAELMTRHNISGLPVVKEGLVLVGIISESDIIEDRTMFSGLDHWISIESFLKRKNEKGLDNNGDLNHDLNSLVRDYMSTRLITAEPGSSVDEVGRLLVRNKVNRIPIIEGKKIVGIITRGDILKAINKKFLEN